MDSAWLHADREKDLRNALRCEDIAPAQRETIHRLDAHWARRGLSVASRRHYVGLAKDLGRFLGRPFEEASKQDLEKYVTSLVERHSPHTVVRKKLFVKVFYKALLAPGSKGHPEIVEWIGASRAELNHRKPIELISKETVLRLAAATLNPRDRALIAVLYESAARVGEMINLRIADVSFDAYGARIKLRGKTPGERTVRLIWSALELQRWIEDHHPLRRNPEAPVFIADSRRVRAQALLHDGMGRILNRAARGAGLNRRIHAHLFRHSRLTELAKELSESELKIFAGWSGDSKMAKVYIHLSGEDVERKMLSKAGLLQAVQNESENVLAVRACVRCGQKNPPSSYSCTKCMVPLAEDDVRRTVQAQEKVAAHWETILQILEHPNLKELLGPVRRPRTLEHTLLATNDGAGMTLPMPLQGSKARHR
jgi:integrase/recombinase XerD